MSLHTTLLLAITFALAAPTAFASPTPTPSPSPTPLAHATPAAAPEAPRVPAASHAPAAPRAPHARHGHHAPPRAPAAPRAPRSHPDAPAPPLAPAPPAPPSMVFATPGHAPQWVAHDGDVEPFVFRVSDGGPRLGVEVSAMSAPLREFFGAPAESGLLVQGVASGSAAEAAKVAVGDVIVEIDGTPIAEVTDVRRALADRSAEKVEVVVIRKKRRKKLKATLPKAEAHAHRGRMVSPFRELPPQVREQVERELAAAQEQIRAVERRLEQMEKHAHRDAQRHEARERAHRSRSDRDREAAKRHRRSRSRSRE